MNLPRDEIAIRKVYEPLVLTGKLTTLFRPGNRIAPNVRGYYMGETVKVKIIKSPGNDDKKIPPTFDKKERKARIKKIGIEEIENLTKEDFVGSSPDVPDIESLRYHLGLIYDKTPEQISKLTRIELEYL